MAAKMIAVVSIESVASSCAEWSSRARTISVYPFIAASASGGHSFSPDSRQACGSGAAFNARRRHTTCGFRPWTQAFHSGELRGLLRMLFGLGRGRPRPSLAS
eukprot:6502375-Prymnesium_polylepis.1